MNWGQRGKKGELNNFTANLRFGAQTPETGFQFLKARPKEVLLLFSASFTFVCAKIHSTFIRARV